MTVPIRPDWREWSGYAPLDAGSRACLAAAIGDVVEGLRRWRLWSFLALDDIRNAYRRTVVGPWWLTLQTAIQIAALSLLFGAVFHQPLREFIPYVGVGYIVFGFIAGMTRFAINVFVDGASRIVSNRQPLSVLVLHGVAVEVLQFAHNVVIVVVFASLGLLHLGPTALLLVPSVVLMAVNGVALAFWLAPIVARFRDIAPIVGSIVQMLAFFTPIFWQVDAVRGAQRTALLAWNPFYYFLESFRAPLLDTRVAPMFAAIAVITLTNVLAAVIVFGRTRSRIPYWVS